LNALVSKKFYSAYVQLPDADSPCLPEIADKLKLYPFFKNCLGAFDGTHITCSPPAEDRAHYLDRKSGLSSNVLAGCTFDLLFCYILSGWEGSASDGTVFEDGRKNDLTVPPGKFYLADVEFGACKVLLVPYRGVHYHLREWVTSKDKPATKEELFNLCHSGARNAIERIFSVAKKRFKMLHYCSDLPINTQAHTVPGPSQFH